MFFFLSVIYVCVCICTHTGSLPSIFQYYIGVIHIIYTCLCMLFKPLKRLEKLFSLCLLPKKVTRICLKTYHFLFNLRDLVSSFNLQIYAFPQFRKNSSHLLQFFFYLFPFSFRDSYYSQLGG